MQLHLVSTASYSILVKSRIEPCMLQRIALTVSLVVFLPYIGLA